MAAFFDFMPDEEDDEESREQNLEYVGKDCLLFLVDCSSASFSKPEDGVTPFHLIAKVLREFLNRKSVKCEKDYVSIVFYGTKLLANSLDVDNVYVYHPLGLPNVDLITDLDQWISGNAKTEIEAKYGIADTYSLSDTIWVCSRILREVKFKVADYHVVLFTPEDNPHSSNNDLRKKALKRSEDLFSFAQFDIIPLKKNFDISKFYEQLRDACDDKFGEGNMFRISDPLVSANLADLSDVLDKKLQPKRSLGSIIFNIGPDVPLGINIYSLIGSQRVPPKTPVRKSDYKEIKGIRQDLRKETRDELLDIDIKLAQTYGGMQIAFEQMEIKDLRTYGPAGMSLIGFKPRSMLKPNYHVRSSQFIYPNDKLVEGSNQLFLALLMKCLERDVVPVCKLISRSNAAPRLVYLLPQAEDKSQGISCGFHVIFMPFADDIRSLSNIITEDQPRADDEQTNKAKEVVKALKFSYKPENFNNPALHKFYNTIESFALSRDSVAPVIDPTIPKCEDMDRKAGAAIAEFKSAVFPENYQPPVKKRPTAASNGARKVNNVEEGGVTDWRAHAESGTLTKFTVAQLKAAANEVGVKLTATRKLDIIDQLAAHFKDFIFNDVDKMAAGLAFMDIELRNPFNMRLKTLKNLQMTQTFQKHPSKMRNLAIQRARTGVCTNPAKALNHLRVVLQNAINREIATVIKHYMDVYFTPTVRNIKDNCGETAVTDEHIVFICRQILEEAQKMYQIPHVSSAAASPSFRMLVIDDGCTSTPSKRKADELLADEDGSDISGSTPYAEATTSTSLAAGSHKKVRMLAVDQSPQQRSSSSTPLSQRFQDITQEDIPKYNPERIKCDTMFIMGSTANKVLGMGTQRGKIYTKHPGLFRYVGDQEDRVWLFDQRLLTRFGGKAYIMLFHDIQELTRSSEYKQNANLKYHELRGFVAPEFMLTKIRKMMQRDYDELLRKFGGNFTDMSLHIVPNGI